MFQIGAGIALNKYNETMRMASQSSIMKSPESLHVSICIHIRQTQSLSPHKVPESCARIMRQTQRNPVQKTKPCAWCRFPAIPKSSTPAIPKSAATAIPKSSTPAIPKSAATAIPSLSLTHSHTRALKTQSLSPHKVRGDICWGSVNSKDVCEFVGCL